MVNSKAQSKKKKQKRGVDFKKIKKKIGRKLPPPHNATNTEIKSKAILLPEQSLAADKAGLAVSKKGLTLKELLQQTSHHNAKVRKDALIGIRDVLCKFPAELKLHKLAVIEKLRERISDDDKLVRETLYQLLESVIFPGCKEDSSGPINSLMMTYIFNAMTHMAVEVRLMAFKFFDLLIQYFPSSFLLYAEKILQNYKDILQKNKFYLQDKGRLKKALAGLVRCLSLLFRNEKKEGDTFSGNGAARASLHAFDRDVSNKSVGLSGVVNKLTDLLPVLVSCFRDFTPLIHSTAHMDVKSFHCMLFLLQSIDIVVRFFGHASGEYEQNFQILSPSYKKNDPSVYDQSISAVTLKKLWDEFPLSPARCLSRKDGKRYFRLNIVITKIFLQLSSGSNLSPALWERFLWFITSSLSGEGVDGSDDDDSDDNEEEASKKAVAGKERPADLTTKTPVPDKKGVDGSDDDDSDDSDEEASKKAVAGKKRPADLATKTPVPDDKKNCNAIKADKAYDEKHLIPLVAFIPKLIMQVSGPWKSQILQAFTTVLQKCSPESSMKLACLSAVEEMLLPEHDYLNLDPSDVEIFKDHQIAWVRELPELLVHLGDKHPLHAKAALRLLLRVGQAAIMDSLVSKEYDNIKQRRQQQEEQLVLLQRQQEQLLLLLQQQEEPQLQEELLQLQKQLLLLQRQQQKLQKYVYMQDKLRDFYYGYLSGSVGDGHFLKLPRDMQEIYICCLYYFPFLDTGLLPSLVSCCICHELEPYILFRIVEVLHSACKAGHVHIADYISFLITLLSRFQVYPEKVYPTQKHEGKSNRETFKSVVSVVCSCLSQIGDDVLILQMLEEVVLKEISHKRPVDNMYGFIRLLITLDTKPTRLSEQTINILSTVLPGYFIDVVSNIPEEDDESTKRLIQQTRHYYVLPCFFLFDRSSILLSETLKVMESFIKGNVSSVSPHQHGALMKDHSSRILPIVSVLLLMHGDVKMPKLLFSCKTEIRNILQSMVTLQSCEDITMTIEERHKIQSAYDGLSAAISTL